MTSFLAKGLRIPRISNLFLFLAVLSLVLLFLFHFYNVFEVVKGIVSGPVCSPARESFRDYSVTLEGRLYPKYVPLHRNSSIDFDCLNRQKEKKILAWTLYFSKPLPYMDGFKQHNCPVTQCSITDDKRLLNEVDLIVVHDRDFVYPFREFHKPSQRWLFMLYESPPHSVKMESLKDLFNYTSTYMPNSDFPGIYEFQSGMSWQLNETFNESFDFSQGRNGLAAMVVSNCNTPNRRREYVNELRAFMQVDVFGNCGEPCPKDERGDCKEIIGKSYKFYLAFENSNCQGYVTEKFFTILQYDIIPVVYGEGNYEDYVPKSGFIHAFDFKTPKHLADYLLYLDKNSTAYNAYFKWKKHVSFDTKSIVEFSPICDMCIWLHLLDQPGASTKAGVQIKRDIDLYWNVPRQCDKRPKYLN